MNKLIRRFKAFSLDPRQQWLIAAAATGIGALLCFRVLYLPLFATIANRYARLREGRVKIADVRVLKTQQPAQENAFMQIRARYQTIERQVGEGQSVARILEILSQQAKNHRLELVAVQPPAEEEEPSRLRLGTELALREVPLNVQLSGRYRQIGEFLGELYHAPFLSSVRQVRLTRPREDRAALQADLVLLVYLAEERR